MEKGEMEGEEGMAKVRVEEEEDGKGEGAVMGEEGMVEGGIATGSKPAAKTPSTSSVPPLPSLPTESSDTDAAARAVWQRARERPGNISSGWTHGTAPALLLLLTPPLLLPAVIIRLWMLWVLASGVLLKDYHKHREVRRERRREEWNGRLAG